MLQSNIESDSSGNSSWRKPIHWHLTHVNDWVLQHRGQAIRQDLNSSNHWGKCCVELGCRGAGRWSVGAWTVCAVEQKTLPICLINFSYVSLSVMVLFLHLSYQDSTMVSGWVGYSVNRVALTAFQGYCFAYKHISSFNGPSGISMNWNHTAPPPKLNVQGSV